MKMVVFWVVALIALIMEAVSTSETSVNFCQTTQCYNPEDSHLHAQISLEGSEERSYDSLELCHSTSSGVVTKMPSITKTKTCTFQ
jgi:hypothetical protein